MKSLFSMVMVAGVWAGYVQADDESIKQLVEGNRQFATQMYRALAQGEENLFFSPHSISVALAMTYAGARGDTEMQMSDALCFPFGQDVLHPIFGELEKRLQQNRSGSGVEVWSANSLWPHKRYTFLPEFLDVVSTYYQSEVIPSDFHDPDRVRKEINTWVEGKTRDKIKDLIPPGALTPMTKMILVNAIYFKGDWLKAFKKTATREEPFFHGAAATRVPMMQGKIPARIVELPDLQVLELPYQGNEVVMLIALPRATNGLAAIEKKLSPKFLAAWEAGMEASDVQVSLPRFTMTGQFSLNDVLMKKGMTDAFDPEKADFSGMDGLIKNLYISDVVHKAFVDVNERGTEAAAATGVIMTTRAMMPRTIPSFRADHPFLFMIKDRTCGSILFMGRLVAPVVE
jgi:serpin B